MVKINRQIHKYFDRERESDRKTVGERDRQLDAGLWIYLSIKEANKGW